MNLSNILWLFSHPCLLRLASLGHCIFNCFQVEVLDQRSLRLLSRVQVDLGILGSRPNRWCLFLLINSFGFGHCLWFNLFLRSLRVLPQWFAQWSIGIDRLSWVLKRHRFKRFLWLTIHLVLRAWRFLTLSWDTVSSQFAVWVGSIYLVVADLRFNLNGTLLLDSESVLLTLLFLRIWMRWRQ